MTNTKEEISYIIQNAIEVAELLSVAKDACSKNNYFELETFINIIFQKQNQIVENLSSIG